jgi:competence protein ComEC
MSRKARYVLAGVLLAVAAGLGWVSRLQDADEVKVVFLDVGQGDAVLVMQGRSQVLIDGGRSGKILLERLGEYMPFGDRTIEAVVATHPDDDHIGGFVDMLEAYRVGALLKTNARGKNRAWEIIEGKLAEKHIRTVETFRDLDIRLPGASFETLFPFGPYGDAEVKDTNATSIVMRLSVGKSVFLLTGDLPSEEEKRLDPGKVTVLKAGHHGSKYSTSDAFLEKIMPEEAVLSVGTGNSYGHPAQETLERLKHRGARILRTDMDGSIAYTCRREAGTCEAAVEKEGRF